MFVCVRVCVCVALCLCRSAMPILLRAPPPLLWLYKRHFNTRQGLRGNADLPEDLSTSGAVVLRFETEAGDDTVAVADELLPFGTGVRLQRISGSPAPGEGVKGVEGEVVVCGVIWCGINHVPKDTRFFHETLTTTHSLTLTLTHTHTHSLSHTHTHTHTHAHTHTHKYAHTQIHTHTLTHSLTHSLTFFLTRANTFANACGYIHWFLQMARSTPVLTQSCVRVGTASRRRCLRRCC